MTPPHMTVDPRTWKRTIEETHRLAEEFIDQYFDSTTRLENCSFFCASNQWVGIEYCRKTF